MPQENINQFSKQSLWEMIGLTIITLTFYIPFWLRKQTQIVNRILPDTAIGSWWFPVSIFVTVLNFGMIVLEMLSNDHPTVILFSKILGRIDTILIIIWIFKIRNRINTILQAEPKQPYWFHGFWTLLFGIFYIQHKINSLCIEEDSVHA